VRPAELKKGWRRPRGNVNKYVFMCESRQSSEARASRDRRGPRRGNSSEIAETRNFSVNIIHFTDIFAVSASHERHGQGIFTTPEI
jgi:hypothetical protein